MSNGLLVTFVSLAKTAESIKMPFGADFGEPNKPCVRWGWG